MKNYLVTKAFNGNGIWGHLEIPEDSSVFEENNIILFKGKKVCYTTSQYAYDYFTRNDDGKGRERRQLITAITSELKSQRDKYVNQVEAIRNDYMLPPDERERRVAEIKDRFSESMEKLYADEKTKKFFNATGAWCFNFYNATISDLDYALNLVKNDENIIEA